MFQELYDAHVAEMQSRWERSMAAENVAAILVHAGTPLISFLDDYEYAFRPSPLFLSWAPLTHHHDSVLLVRPGERPILWFYQPEDYWYLPPADPESWWADPFDVRIVSNPEAWSADLPPVPSGLNALGDSKQLKAHFPESRLNPPGLLTRIQLERTRKTAYEIACMRKANQQAVAGHLAAERAFRDGGSEFDIHLAYLAACRQNDARLPYHNIVALNGHGAVLHYQGRDIDRPERSRSFLIDAGSTVNAYAADITRSHARESGEFCELIRTLDTLQQDLAGKVRPGIDFKALHVETHLGIAGILANAGIIKISAEDAVACGLSSVFFPHGLGHFIGLQTHDVGGLLDNDGIPVPRPDGHPFLRLTRVLEAGNVVTIEPGLYFIESLLERWKAGQHASAVNWRAVEALSPFGGIRIEDNVVATASGPENLTRGAFAAASSASHL